MKMNMLKYSALFLLFVAGLTFSSCNEDEPTETTDNIISGQDDPDLKVSDLKGEITGDITLAASRDWVLTGPLVVNDGGSLTIEAGTTIMAAAGGTNVYIAVERGGEIQAIGTAALPIKMTSNAAAPASGDWGGLLVMGYASITGGGSAVTEVVDFIYGGDNDADDSGDIAYLILEYTGARINGEKEFNGLTLYGVGSGTSINNVFIKAGDDDAIEFFGGTVNVSKLLVVNAKDDMFDYTQGYSGTATDVYMIRESGFTEVTSDPRGIEGDGNLDGLTPGLTPQSNPTITNMTIVNQSTAVITDVVKIRRGSSATVTNVHVIFSATSPAPGDFVDMADSAGDAAGTASVNISGEGANINTADNNIGSNNGTVTIPATANTGCSSTIFAWTGYTF